MSAGIRAMLNYLSGGSENDPQKYYGKKISFAKIDEENNRFQIDFEDGTKIDLWDDGQSCCENRYMRTDDDPNWLVGKKLVSMATKYTEEIDEWGGSHEIVFLEVSTDQGSIVFSNHNEHNGYCGGFGLTITERK